MIQYCLYSQLLNSYIARNGQRSNETICDPTRRKGTPRDLVISRPCRAENYLSNDIKYVKIRQILTKLQSSEHTTVGTNRNGEMANYLLFIDIIRDN